MCLGIPCLNRNGRHSLRVSVRVTAGLLMCKVCYIILLKAQNSLAWTPSHIHTRYHFLSMECQSIGEHPWSGQQGCPLSTCGLALLCEFLLTPENDMQTSNKHFMSHLLVCKPLAAVATVRHVASEPLRSISLGTSARQHFDRCASARDAMMHLL